MPWNMEFDEPINLPNGREARTLRQAATYIFKLPADEHKHPKWQTAMHVLIEAAEGRGPVTFARLGMMQAILKDVEPTEGPGKRNRPATKWGRRKLARDL